MMEQGQLDEFEQATYSQSDSQPQQPTTSMPNSIPAVAGPQLINDVQGEDAVIPASAFPSSLQASAPLENSSVGQEQSVWPQLGKTNSAQGAAHDHFEIDFSKSYSLTEQISNTVGNDFLGLDFTASVEPQNITLPQQTPSETSHKQQPQSSITFNNDFLAQFTAPQTTFDEFGSKKEEIDLGEAWEKVELVQNSAENGCSTNLYAPVQLNATNNFDLFAPMAEDTSKKQQQQVKIEVKEAEEVLDHEEHLLQLGMQQTPTIISENMITQQQTILTINDTQSFISQEQNFHSAWPKKEENNLIQTYSPTNNIQITYQAAGQTQVEVFENNVVSKPEERKESDQFEFHQAKVAEPDADVRKQSEEFVFQTAQQSPSIPEEPLHTPIVNETQVKDNVQWHQQEPLSAVEQKPLVQHQKQKEQEDVAQHRPVQEDEDQFGDFEETTQVQDSNNQTQQITMNGNSHEDNTLHIKQEYSNSQQTAFYRDRLKQLQNFVDSLPDYSFLFVKGFIPS